MSHKKFQHLTLTHVLELLNMDLMGPMQVEIYRGIIYVFVYVDDLSRCTWVDFICEKSNSFTFRHCVITYDMKKEKRFIRYSNSKWSRHGIWELKLIYLLKYWGDCLQVLCSRNTSTSWYFQKKEPYLTINGLSYPLRQKSSILLLSRNNEYYLTYS